MTKPTLRALVLIAVFVLSEAAAYWLYKLWYASRYDPNVNAILWEVVSTLKGIVLFAVFPTGIVAFTYRHIEFFVPPGD